MTAMTAAQKKIAAKRAKKPVYLTPCRLMDPETSEMVPALRPLHPADQRLMRERRYHVGQELRAILTQSRNVKFHRLSHAVGHLLVDHVDGFESLSAHEALKRVQIESGICCEVMVMQAGPVVTALLDAAEVLLGAGARKILGAVLPGIKEIPVKVARSIAFDEMDESEFGEFFKGITDYIDANYSAGLTDDVKAEYLLMIEGDPQR